MLYEKSRNSSLNSSTPGGGVGYYRKIIMNMVHLRKGITSHIFQILALKRLYLWNHSSYELQTLHEYSLMILLHVLPAIRELHPFSVWVGRVCTSIAFDTLFGSSLEARRHKLQTNQVWSLGLKWWWQKIVFCAKLPLFSNSLTYMCMYEFQNPTMRMEHVQTRQ